MRISDWSSDVCSSDLNLALALLAGVVIAGGAVFVREQLDDAIRAPEDIERKLGLPTLGAIPISGADDLREELALPRSPMAEAYNSLRRSEEHTSELQSLMRISYAVFCLKKKI